MISEQQLKTILEGALLAAGRPLSLDDFLGLFDEQECPEREAVRAALQSMQEDTERSFVLKEVASGYRLQVKRELTPWISRLWMERPSRYSRALLETLALVAYRQPITRGEIEDIRGVSVSSSIMKTLQEREWIRVVGHRDVPGKPAMYGTTKQFLDYFDLKSLDELPTLAELRDIDSINAELDLGEPGQVPQGEHETEEAALATAELESAEASSQSEDLEATSGEEMAPVEAGESVEGSELSESEVEPRAMADDVEGDGADAEENATHPAETDHSESDAADTIEAEPEQEESAAEQQHGEDEDADRRWRENG